MNKNKDIQEVIKERDLLALLCSALMLDIEHNLGEEKAKKIWKIEIIRIQIWYYFEKGESLIKRPLERLKEFWGKR